LQSGGGFYSASGHVWSLSVWRWFVDAASLSDISPRRSMDSVKSCMRGVPNRLKWLCEYHSAWNGWTLNSLLSCNEQAFVRQLR